MGKKAVMSLLLGSLVLVALAGCKSFNGEKTRREHAASYREQLALKTGSAVKAKEELTLQACIQIALANNLDVQSADIRSRIAKLERKTAFANFLPTVSLNYQKTYFDPQVVMKLGGFETAMSDKRVREVTWDVQMSIFNPATWFLYSMYSRGAQIADLVAEYTRQMIVLQVTADYFYCLSLGEYERAVESQLKAAETLQTELEAFHAEGLVTDWQVGEAQLLAQARRVELGRAKRTRAQAKAELLAAMGLSPLAEVTLQAETPLEPQGGTLEDLLTEALLCHRQLQISDLQIEIEREKVKTAFASFLPVLQGFATHMDSSDSFLKYSTYWAGGLAGTMAAFNGFANINEYKAARERHRESFIEREQASLAVMLEVIRAYLALETAREETALASQALDVASRRFRESRQKWQEGLIRASEMLDVTAKRDKAHMQAISSRFRYQVTVATLLNAMGKTQIDYEEPEHDGAS